MRSIKAEKGEGGGVRARGSDDTLPTRILIVRNGALGDFILTLPVIDSLKNAFSGAEITVMGDSAIVRLAEERISEIIHHDLPGLHTLYQQGGAIPEPIRRKMSSFDVVISYSPDREGDFAGNLSRIGNRRVIDGGFSSSEVPETHVTERLLEPLRKEGIAVSPHPPHVVPSSRDRQLAGRFLGSSEALRKNSRILVALHPGSGNSKKCWPPENFSQLARWIDEVFDATIVVIFGPADQGVRQVLMPLLHDLNPIVVEQFSVTQVAAILERCTLYVGNDSGITHLAASLGIPALALFGPTDFRVWGPKNKNVQFLQASYSCAPCLPEELVSCYRPRCMEALDVETVKEVTLKMLSELSPSASTMIAG